GGPLVIGGGLLFFARIVQHGRNVVQGNRLTRFVACCLGGFERSFERLECLVVVTQPAVTHTDHCECLCFPRWVVGGPPESQGLKVLCDGLSKRVFGGTGAKLYGFVEGPKPGCDVLIPCSGCPPLDFDRVSTARRTLGDPNSQDIVSRNRGNVMYFLDAGATRHAVSHNQCCSFRAD